MSRAQLNVSLHGKAKQGNLDDSELVFLLWSVLAEAKSDPSKKFCSEKLNRKLSRTRYLTEASIRDTHMRTPERETEKTPWQFAPTTPSTYRSRPTRRVLERINHASTLTRAGGLFCKEQVTSVTSGDVEVAGEGCDTTAMASCLQ